MSPDFSRVTYSFFNLNISPLDTGDLPLQCSEHYKLKNIFIHCVQIVFRFGIEICYLLLYRFHWLATEMTKTQNVLFKV